MWFWRRMEKISWTERVQHHTDETKVMDWSHFPPQWFAIHRFGRPDGRKEWVVGEKEWNS